ncbi:MAG: hypothetical protein NT066_02905, partial [Candidatus Omnitrophica bacterium]|nr:hypothetical protein [Candidatus Omnitrophota bacterium]
MAIKLKDSYIIVLLSLMFIAVIAIPKVFFVELDHGDEFSDAGVLMSGKNFVKLGFIKCKFLPVIEPHLLEPKGHYTHAPPMSDITNGLLRKIFKTDSLRFFRGASLFFSLLNLLFWYLFVRKFSNSFLVGFLAALFYFTNPFFIYGADSLYQNAYSDFLRAFIFYLFLYILISPRVRKIGLIILFMVFALLTSYTFEYIAYLGLFLLAFRYFYVSRGQKLSLKYIFMVFLAPICVIALHFMQNAWYFGSFGLAYQDLKNIAIERITHSSDSPFGAVTLANWWNYVLLRYISLVFIFDFYILIPFALFFFMLYQNLDAQNKNESRRIFFLCLLLLACGISWYAIFPSHALAHTFILFLPRHLVPAAALAFACCCYIMYHFVRKQNPQNVFGKLALAAIIIIISVSGLLKSELPITKEALSGAGEFLVFKHCLLSIRATPRDKAG